MITVTAFILATSTSFALAFVFGFVAGSFVADGHQSKRYCNEYLRRIAKNGFNVDGDDYEVARRIVRGAELLGRAGR